MRPAYTGPSYPPATSETRLSTPKTSYRPPPLSMAAYYNKVRASIPFDIEQCIQAAGGKLSNPSFDFSNTPIGIVFEDFFNHLHAGDRINLLTTSSKIVSLLDRDNVEESILYMILQFRNYMDSFNEDFQLRHSIVLLIDAMGLFLFRFSETPLFEKSSPLLWSNYLTIVGNRLYYTTYMLLDGKGHILKDALIRLSMYGNRPEYKQTTSDGILRMIHAEFTEKPNAVPIPIEPAYHPWWSLFFNRHAQLFSEMKIFANSAPIYCRDYQVTSRCSSCPAIKRPKN